ncbi:hypothetical protein KBY24_10710 [Ruegeria pomeroyi]|uniref:Uncharacterized protein n=1 Tax=Ruegeria alba TaxID=2916756 RepID=A0ABS9NVG2_9RHOB|nr:hypothetical protein [Ruegeria alba]MCE8512448.1 hypothetical protein [Ruegeria pomeroyi]MCE8521576.1 hypothetical protein [Ruegeria pomeroyi]MCE8525227.1 hypothetical protein [Ruegeria pomeroyi]MCE8529261.1 hypothetical protein [Ruegeria pomeroyi]MCE8533859.1 hypothetical protein [Ruegeria pomeroyi]
MQITNVEISQYHVCPSTARHSASVCMTLADRMVTLFCSLELPEEISPLARTQAFVGDAMRQLRRMPEFRSGKDQLYLDDQVLPAVA